MRPRRLIRPSPATAIALLALFVSLGGTTYAVTALPRNSVGSDQLRDRAVKEAELARSAVITSKLADRAVTRRKLALGSVSADRVLADALGGGQIDESSLSAVPLARDAERSQSAQRAGLADSAERADVADSAERADRADRAGVADALGRVETESVPLTVPLNLDGSEWARCGPGRAAVGGGFLATDAHAIPFISESGPLGDGWFVTVIDGFGSGPFGGRVYATCVAVDGP